MDMNKLRYSNTISDDHIRKTHPAFRLIRYLVWLFSPKYKVSGIENLPEGPAIIAGNHSQMFGPIASELYCPGRHYTWCISEMMEKDKVAEYAYKDFWSQKPAILRPYYKLAAHLIPHLAEFIFTNADTIPVYRDRRIMKTFQITGEKLSEGARVVIFPEDYDEYNNIVHHFQRGFIHTAKYYYRQKGECIPFVPMYICPALKQIVFGKPIFFDPGKKTDEEAERICAYLQEAISEIAYALPRHRVTPYPNISKRNYPFNDKL